jgi:uncharacterized phage-associated protein
MVKAVEVAEWFVERARNDYEQEKGDLLTQISIQKLLYFAQGIYAANYPDEKLFNENIYHEAYGPVVTSLSDYIKANGSSPIDHIDDLAPGQKISYKRWSLAEKQRIFPLLSNVYDTFGSFSAFKLVEFTHGDPCWQNTKNGQVIPVSEIAASVKARYIKA